MSLAKFMISRPRTPAHGRGSVGTSPSRPLRRGSKSQLEISTIITEEDVKVEKLHIQNLGLEKKIQDSYECCCFPKARTNKHLLKYIVQASMAFIVVIFCFIQIVLSDAGDPKEIYFSLISMILGYMLDAPKVEGNSQE